MLVDEIILHFKAGRGGDGVVRWRKEKGKDHAGPSGGNGGKGGDVYALAVRDAGILSAYKNVKEFSAKRGDDGFRDSKQGAEGESIEVRLPVGARLTNISNGFTRELLVDGERVLLLKGGRGGVGNEFFKSSINTKPEEFTEGEEGEESDFKIELLLTADIGIIGLPNAGKSSLLNSLTKARSKVGDFPFTTLDPALGDLYGLILADIPGLIEGASEGRGLGHKFLKHIERTKALLHCISAEHEDPSEVYELVRKELGFYNEDILDKREIIVLTKTDTIEVTEVKKKMKMLSKFSKEVLSVSVIDDESVKKLGEYLTQNIHG